MKPRISVRLRDSASLLTPLSSSNKQRRQGLDHASPRRHWQVGLCPVFRLALRLDRGQYPREQCRVLAQGEGRRG